MPWTTPTLSDVRKRNRDYIVSRLTKPILPNSVTRVVADASGGLAHLNLQYLDWLALQLMPDTAETEWLDRHGNIWLINYDGSTGRKAASSSSGTVTVNGTPNAVSPIAAQLIAPNQVTFQTTQEVLVGADGTCTVPLTAIDAGAASNIDPGETLNFSPPVAGLNNATVISLLGGADEETDDELRARVLERIRNPPMGGDAEDYVHWALEYPGVTRAWAAPLEMGMGTVTVRFMMDDLRSGAQGFPNPQDVLNVEAWLRSVSPVAIKDIFVVAPIREPINFTLSNLDSDDSSTRQNIADSVTAMIRERAAPNAAHDGILVPAQTIYTAWVSEAISNAAGVNYFDLTMTDHAMPTGGSLAVFGNMTMA
jgi:uncharacterized phage protein gp47/JayE